MTKGILLLAGITAAVAVAVGGSMSGDPIAVPDARSTDVTLVEPAEPALEPATIAKDGTVELRRSDDGHFYADVAINGSTIRALVDTGASAIALSREDARSAGIATSIAMPGVVGQGADGEVYGEVVTLESVALGHRTAEGMTAVVLNSGEQTLLGQSFLARFDSLEIRGDTMVLR